MGSRRDPLLLSNEPQIAKNVKTNLPCLTNMWWLIISLIELLVYRIHEQIMKLS